MTLSKTHEQQEAKAAQIRAEQEAAEQAAKTTYYVSPAERYQIANFVTEERAGEKIVRPEEPLEFRNFMFATTNPKVIAFIESSSSFKNSQVKKVADMDAVNAHVRQIRIRKGVTKIENKE